MTPGMLKVIHTFGSNLSLHYHLHVKVSRGDLTAGGKEFKRCFFSTFFLPVKVLNRLFLGKFMDGLKQLREGGRLSLRTSIFDSRVESCDNESTRRFLMHILPSGFAWIRSAGFMAGCVRKKNLERIHSLIGSTYEESPAKAMTAAELIRHFYHRNATICEKCHGILEIYPQMSRISAALMIRAA